MRWPARRALVLLLAAAPLDAPQRSAGFVDRAVRLRDATYRYQVYLPAGRRPREGWPVVLFLHGAGERGDDGRRPAATGLGEVIRRHRDWFQAVVVFPQVTWPDSFWAGTAEAIALSALDAAIAEFHGDTDRVYLTGLSMGGFGTWRTAAEHPDRFAAIAVLAGGLPDPLPVGAPSAVDDGPAYLAERVRALPSWVVHGDRDTFQLAGTRLIVAALRRLGAEVRYTEYAGAGHDESWQRGYDDPALWRWLFAQRRARARRPQ